MANPSVNIHVISQRIREQAAALELDAASERQAAVAAGVTNIAMNLAKIVSNMDSDLVVRMQERIASDLMVVIDDKILELQKAYEKLTAAEDAATETKPKPPFKKGK